MKAKRQAGNDEMRSEYKFDYASAVRGKYCRRLLKEGVNIVVLEPDVAKAFRNSAAVNEALRSRLKMSEDNQAFDEASRGYKSDLKALETSPITWEWGQVPSLEAM